MTTKEKRRGGGDGSHSEPQKGATAKDSIDNSAMTDAKRIGPEEVFDSSRYSAMSDMTTGSNLETKNVEGLSDIGPGSKSLKSEQIDNKSITTLTAADAAVPQNTDGLTTSAEKPKITPMIVEERARTIREVNEDENRLQASSSSTNSVSSEPHPGRKEEKFVLYLNLMLSIENATIERLHARLQQQSLLAEVREQLVRHLEETSEQKNRLTALVRMLGGQPTDSRGELPSYSPPKVLADTFKTLITRPEEQELKTLETDALIEYAEVVGYNTLIQMATTMNIGEAIAPLRQNLQEEEKMVGWMRANLPSNFVRLWSKTGDGDGELY